MINPDVSLVLCTVRPSQAYANHPEWDAIGKVCVDLANQIDAPPFELVIVDGLHGRRQPTPIWNGVCGASMAPIRHIPPRAGSPWVRMRKIAIAAYRNTGIAAARGELIVNLDDACELPPNFVSTFWNTWRETGTAAAMIWPDKGDRREPGPLPDEQFAYGFSSYPRELLLSINGYDEAYDGGKGLEDMDMSTRVRAAGLRQTLVALPGFDQGSAQTGHASEAIDPVRPICKCCNQAWNTERVWRHVVVANRADLWTREALERLVGPCRMLDGERCGHHQGRYRCAYYDDQRLPAVPDSSDTESETCAPGYTEARSFARHLDPEAAVVFDEPPVVDLRELAKEYR